jgi:hypothetical protein
MSAKIRRHVCVHRTRFVQKPILLQKASFLSSAQRRKLGHFSGNAVLMPLSETAPGDYFRIATTCDMRRPSKIE